MRNDTIFEKNKEYLLSLSNPNVFMLQQAYDNNQLNNIGIGKTIIVLTLAFFVFIIPILIATGFIIGGANFIFKNIYRLNQASINKLLYHGFLIVFGFSILFLIVFITNLILRKQKK